MFKTRLFLKYKKPIILYFFLESSESNSTEGEASCANSLNNSLPAQRTNTNGSNGALDQVHWYSPLGYKNLTMIYNFFSGCERKRSYS